MNKGFYLTLLMGSAVPKPVPKGVIEALTDVQVTSSAGSTSGFQLKFTLGKKSKIGQQLLPSGFFDPKTRCIIVVTVKGTPHVLMDGVITRQDVTPSSESGESTLSVTGQDLSVFMDFIELTGIPYPAMPPSARVALILAKYAIFGVVPLVIPDVVGLMENPIEGFARHEGTDLSYINDLAKKAGYIFYIDPGPKPGMSIAYWGPEIRRGAPQPSLSINMDSATNVESLSFSYDGLAREQFYGFIVEKNTKLSIPVPLPDIDLLKPPLAEKKAEFLKVRQKKDLGKFNAAKALSVLLGGFASGADAVSGNGQLDVVRYGHVLKSRQLVAVRGAGIKYNGLYYVKSVTHNIKRGEYKQRFSLVRGGTISTLNKVSV